MNDMRIYVASLSDYNNGRLEGKWLDLSDYSDASELMEAIQEMLDELTEKYKSVDGEVREEWAVHDYEGIPSTLASEYMSEQDFQQLYDIAEVADDRGIPVEVLVERAGDTGSDDYQALADSLMFVVDGYDESDIVAEYESQIGDLGIDFWSNHIYIDDVTERVIYGEDVDRFREDILYENPDLDEDEAERQAEEMADEEAERREDLTTYLEDMGYGDSIPDFVSKDYEGAWKRSLSYDFDVINHDGEMYVFSNNYSLGGTILSGMIGAYIGYKIGRAKPQKKGFETEKKIGRKIKGAFSKKKMAQGGGVSYRSRDIDKIKVGDIVQYAHSNSEYEAEVIDIVYDSRFKELSSVTIKWLDNGKIEESYLQDLMLSKDKKMARGGSTSKSDLDILIDEINEKSGGRFYIGGAYGNYELWGKDKDGGDHRIEVGSRKDIREALIKNRYNSKFTEYAQGGGVGEDVSKSLYVSELYDDDGNFLGYTIQDKYNVSGKYTLTSSKERAEENRQYLIDNPSRLAYYRKNEYAKGGGIPYNDAVAEFNAELMEHPIVIELAKNYNKTPQEVVKNLQPRISTKGNRGGNTTEVSINFTDSNTNKSVKYSKKFSDGGGVDGKKYFTIYRDEEGSVKTEFDNYSDALADYNEFASDDANIALYEVINGENDLLKENESSAGIEYVELSNGDIVVTLEKIDGRWEEGEVLDGETPYGWGGKRYMGYLKPKDLAQWLSKDYGGNFEIVNQYAKGGGVDEEKIWEIIYKDRGVQKSILVEGYSHILEENNWRNKNPSKEFIQIRLYGNKHSKGGGISGLDDLLRG